MAANLFKRYGGCNYWLFRFPVIAIFCFGGRRVARHRECRDYLRWSDAHHIARSGGLYQLSHC